MSDVSAAVDRLNALLPLAERRLSLDPPLRAVHDAVLRGYLRDGTPPPVDSEAVRRLAALDLVVLDAGGAATGAYPFTSERTPHAVHTGTTRVHAMCSLDALAVAPVFDTNTHVISRCAETGAAIEIRQDRGEAIPVSPPHPWIGIKWLEPCGHAATSLCREMVFLADEDAAVRWRGDDADSAAIFALPEAVRFATDFFGALGEPAG